MHRHLATITALACALAAVSVGAFDCRSTPTSKPATIAGNGDTVSAMVAESALDDVAVESCVLRKTKRWVFPEASDDIGAITKVQVSWVFDYRSAE